MCKTTHASFAVAFSYLIALLIDRQYNTGLNFYLMIMLTPLLASKGAKFPDYDQNWHSISERTTFSWLVNRAVKLSRSGHRSKLTHSWDLCGLSLLGLYLLVNALHLKLYFTDFDLGVAYIILFGFYSGWVSHLISDMFNGDGVWPTIFAKRKIAFVPKRLFGIEFKTGGAWEKFFYKMSCVASKILGFICLLHPILSSGILLKVFYGS